MLDFLRSGPDAVCGGLNAIGIECTQTVLQINVWHLILSALVFVLVTATVMFVRRHKRLDRYHTIEKVSCPYGAAPVAQTIRVHPYSFARAIGHQVGQLNKTDVAATLNDKYSRKFFVVEIREGTRKILTKELKVIAWRYSLSEEEIQVDPITLRQIKGGSESLDDDDLDDTFGAEGTFDVHFRPVQWWDIRHWLNHPSREIRYALYVAIFAALLEYSSDIIELFRTLFAYTPA